MNRNQTKGQLVGCKLYSLPGEKLVTSGPTLSTTPAASWPSTKGNGLNFIPFLDSYKYSQSVWHTPVATICPKRQGADSRDSFRMCALVCRKSEQETN